MTGLRVLIGCETSGRTFEGIAAAMATQWGGWAEHERIAANG